MTGRRQDLAAFTSNLPANSRLRAVQPVKIYCSNIGRDFSAKMDIASIPKVNSVPLMGLDFSMRPEKVRYEAQKGFTSATPESFAMHTIKSIAIMVYQQERFTPMYHDNVCAARNPLAYFICAVHCQAAPQQKKNHGRQTSISSDQSASSQASCESSTSKKSCELPLLATSSTLPLGYWDGLYYALLAEIRLIHSDLQERYGWAIEGGNQTLHYRGTDGSTEKAVTAIDLASMLESAWYKLMDSRLVAALDDAVMMRKLFKNSENKRNSEASNASSENSNASSIPSTAADDGLGDDWRPPAITGLIDINGMGTTDILEMLWNDYSPEIDQAVSENFVDQSMLTDHDAQLHGQQIDQARQALTDMSLTTTCRCRGTCICHVECDHEAGTCTCYSRPHSLHKPPTSPYDDAELEREYLYPGAEIKAPEAQPGTSPFTEMQFKGGSPPASIFTQARIGTQVRHDQPRKMPSRYKSRPRTDTESSDLPNVPAIGGSRGKGKGKDKYPLGFYTDGSPGRYPKLRHEPRSESQSSQMGDAATYPHRMPARKPVAQPFEPVSQVAPMTEYGVVTPPDNGYSANAFGITMPTAPYHTNAKLHEQMMSAHSAVTDSFPVSTEKTRRTGGSDPFVDNAGASEYVGLLAQHPSSLDDVEQVNESFPAAVHSNPITPPRAPKASGGLKSSKISKSTTNLPTLRSLGGNTSKPVPPLPPLPEPSFNAPRPATVQRYVSAGGNMPLSERAEIAGPAFQTSSFGSSIQHSSGAGITKAEIDAKMDDPEWVRKHFGEAAKDRVSLTPPRRVRGSADSQNVRSSENSGRPSMEQGNNNARERTSSGARRLWRVFSRNNNNNNNNNNSSTTDQD